MSADGRLLLVLGLLLPAGLTAHGQVTKPLAASANAYVLRGSASTDQSEARSLVTKRLNDSNTRIGYARFDVSLFLSNYPVANLTGARLRLYLTGVGSADTLLVYGLGDTNVDGISDGAWAANMTWNTQPAKTASPNDITGSASALPNANTTVLLGSQSFTTNVGEVDVTLSVSDLQTLFARGQHPANHVVVLQHQRQHTGLCFD